MQRITASLSDGAYERLRQRAFNERRSLASFAGALIEEALGRAEDEPVIASQPSPAVTHTTAPTSGRARPGVDSAASSGPVQGDGQHHRERTRQGEDSDDVPRPPAREAKPDWGGKKL